MTAYDNSNDVTLADILTIERSASIFYSYARETDISLQLVDESRSLTIFAPTNRAVVALPRKPHQGPPDVVVSPEISEQQLDEMSKSHVEKWITAHIIPQSVDLSSGQSYDTLLPGTSISFCAVKTASKDEPEWKQYTICPDIPILSVKQASNGVLYLIDGTIEG
ncbi:hypothetical protein SISSUDRAFT_1057392 [Sistotremastrum suecicum HHB10207 ss-3]|uniref:FAS1 domain-containing protein n=1 Tax=Sistotremastrum suecicum HHB10207 ss-3 TaxID=1314776 RepID=A0A166ILF9_9AGAM|nr:hypothetical protein SISSUDRAFT_1057392 [Sistotremastrum suecicum HHB10207 ss-3]